jgi:hypothetical protein
MKCSAEGGILFNCFVAQSVEATNVRRNDFEEGFAAGISIIYFLKKNLK